MRLNNFLFTSILAVGMMACKTVQPLAAVQPRQTLLVPYGPAWAALWQQQSAEYKALCFQAYNLAALRLNESLQQQNGLPPAIVTDIDETILDNSPFTVHTALQGVAYSDQAWQEWTAKAAADTVPGALSFLKYAASKGVQIFYITNRAAAEKAATLKNLQRWKFPDADDAHLLLKTTGSAKEERRKLVAQTHNILLFLGDNLNDFSGIFEHQPYQQREQLTKQSAIDFGSRFIVLPNPMYGDWLPALFQYNWKQPVPQLDSVLQSKLKNYE